MEQIKQWVQDHYTPVVLVAATPAAEAICAGRNGLGIVDILRPLGHVRGLEASIRIGDELLKVPNIKLRFHSAATLQPPKPEALEQHLHSLLHASSAKHLSSEPRPDVLAASSGGRGSATVLQQLSPWFNEYTAEFLRLTGWGEHAMVDHPVAGLLFAPADVANPVQHFEALMAQAPLPPLMQQEVMYPLRDREFPRHYVLLQDAAGALADDKRAVDNLLTLRRTFGDASASLLKINTGTGERGSQGATPELFRRFMYACLPGGGAGEPDARPAAPPQGLGAWLSVADLDAVATCLRDFVSLMLLPRLEERAGKLNACITATRRGLRNRITRLWKGASDDTVTDKPYPWHSVESQMRQLGDLAFLLGAYGFAAEVYRLASQDYSASGNIRWYAGAEEMRGLAIIMAPNDNDPQKYLVRAYEGYARLGTPAGRLLATRAALLCARFQQAVGRYLAASVMLMRPHQEEENARAAVLLEQSSLCLLCTSPPSTRKFAFHMVLAGLRYNAAGLKRLGLNAYRQVQGVYVGRSWRAIEEHLHDVLGRLCREAGDDPAAVPHFLALLEAAPGSGRNAAAQAHYLDQFGQCVKSLPPKDPEPGSVPTLPGLCLPFLNTADFEVLFADNSCSGNPTAVALPDASWAALEVACSGDPSVMRDAAAAALKQQTRDHEEFNQTAAGEAVGIRIHLRNRLGVKLRVAALRLLVDFNPLEGCDQILDALCRNQGVPANSPAPPAPPQRLAFGAVIKARKACIGF